MVAEIRLASILLLVLAMLLGLLVCTGHASSPVGMSTQMSVMSAQSLVLSLSLMSEPKPSLDTDLTRVEKGVMHATEMHLFSLEP